jgi:DNA-binding response OmpR family regulator
MCRAVMHVLLLEDEADLAALTKSVLDRNGFVVDICTCLEEAGSALRLLRYDVAIVDLGLPDGDGLTLLREMRAGGNGMRTLILTARDGISDRIEALNAGADDYLIKPFHFEELVARLRALLRRPGEVLGDVLSVGNVTFDTVRRVVQVGAASYVTSRRELDLLERLMRGAGRVVTKEWLVDSLFELDKSASPNAVEVSVHRLRKGLSAAGASIAISTVRGLGYLLVENSECSKAT